MKRYYAGLDFHKSTSKLHVLDQDGAAVLETTLRSDPEALISAVRGIDGEVNLTFEESSHARWLWQLLEPHVDELVVCHPGHIAQDSNTNKTDAIDAERLARYLRLGELTPVRHGPDFDTDLKELVSLYRKVNQKLVRAKCQLKDIFSSRKISCSGKGIYDREDRREWRDKLDRPVLQLAADHHWRVIDLLAEDKEVIKAHMIEVASARPGFQSVTSLPGIGDIRGAQIMGIVGIPERFPGKRKFWKYCSMAVVTKETGETEPDGRGGFRRKRKTTTTRGLNRDGCFALKEIFKGAAQTAIGKYDEVYQDFKARCADKDEALARVDIARKLASQCLTVWKRKETYDAQKARWKKL